MSEPALDLATAYTRHAEQLRRYVVRRIGPHDADDILSSLWLKAVEAAPSYQERGYPVAAWLYRIAQAKLVDYIRYRDRRQRMHLSYEMEGPALVTEGMPDWSILRAIKPAQRAAIVLTYLGYDGYEAAALMGTTPGAIKALKHRGRVNLRRMYGRD